MVVKLNYQKILVRLLRMAKGKLEDTWETQSAVLSAEVGHYAKCVQYARACPSEYNAHKADAARAIGDLIIQCQIVCEFLGLDFNFVTVQSFAAFRDKMKEVSERRKG